MNFNGLYFIQDASNGAIKVGYTSNIQQELRRLLSATSQQLLLLAVMSDGDYEDKNYVLESFPTIQGSWLLPVEDLLLWIVENAVVVTTAFKVVSKTCACCGHVVLASWGEEERYYDPYAIPEDVMESAESLISGYNYTNGPRPTKMRMWLVSEQTWKGKSF